MNRLRLASLALLIAAVFLAPAGCKKAAEVAALEKAPGAEPVSEEERALAIREVNKLWSDPAVEARVKARKPTGEEVDFYRDLAVLSRHEHRLAGYGSGRDERVGDKTVRVFDDVPGSLSAGYYVANRLKAMGVEIVLTAEFPVVVPITTECRLVVDGKEYGPAEGFCAVRPNHLQASVTTAEGLTGRTVYAGSGELSEYTASAKGAIVVLDFASGDRWKHAFAMGAKAVIFIGQDGPAPNTFHHLNFPANLPRFYVTAERAEQLRLKTASPTVTIYAACRWRTLEGRNVIGVLRGTNSKFGDEKRAQAIMLSAPLDSLSEVPTRSPGARGAANCAALLALTKYFKDNRPKRDVIVCFLDGDAWNHAGARALFGRMYRWKEGAKYQLVEPKDRTLRVRLEMLQAEQEFIRNIEAVVAEGNVFSDKARDMPEQGPAVLRMRSEAKAMAAPVREELQLLRIEKRRCNTEIEGLDERLKGTAGPAGDTARHRKSQLEARIAALNKQIAALRAEDESWSGVERTLNKKTYPTGEGGEKARKVLEKYNLLLDKMKRLSRKRQDELELAVKYVKQGQLLAGTIGDVKNLIVLDLVLDLGDRSDRWMFVHGQDSQTVHKSSDGLSEYAKIHQAIRKVARARKLELFEPRTVEAVHNVRMFAPGLCAHSGAVAGVFGVPNLALMTPMDRRVRDGQPCDVVWHGPPDGKLVPVLNAGNMIRAVGEIAPFLKALGDEPDMSLPSRINPVATYTEYTFSEGKYAGASANVLSGASAMPDQFARGAFVALMPRPATKIWEGARVDMMPSGFSPIIMSQVDTKGRFELPPLSGSYYGQSVVLVARHDNRGLIEYVNNTTTLQSALPLTTVGSVLFRATGMTIVGLGYDRGAVTTRALKAISTAALNEKYSLVCESGSVLTVYVRRATEKLKLFNPSGMVVLGNADAKDRIVGEGWPIDTFAHWPTTEITARDLHVLDGERLAVLNRHRILEPSLERLHFQAADLMKKAQATEPDDVQARAGKYAGAAAISRRVYQPLLSVLNDLVLAVVLLLLLAIPFAYSIERLLVGSPHIYRQIAWFVVFFLITFAVLYMVNPAFRIAATPIVIFLAFAIILLSSLVIVIMARKLESEVRRMQGLGTTVHSSDVSRLGTMMAAVHMGISTMRRRPIRTLLTAVTVVLLTFTILTFASFSSSWGNRRTYTGPMSGKPRLLVRHPLWTRISQEVPDMLDALLADSGEVVPRYWVAQTAGEVEAYRTAGRRSKEILAADASGKKIVGLSALVGLDKRDVDRLGNLREVFVGQADKLSQDGVFLTSPVAKELGLSAGDKVCIDGVSCTLAGVIDRRKMTSYRLLEGSSMLPVDYEASGGGQAATFQQQETTAVEDLPETESAQFIYFSPDRVAIIPAEMARNLGGRVASVTIYPGKADDTEKLGQLVATVTGLPTYLGAKGGVYRLFFTSLTQASGWKDLLIPVILGGLILFATMLGSVSDREKEIYAFSALGLAPPHVASLFFAEAGVYAVVGGMGGYMLGQIVARALGYVFETFGILSVPMMNYSSTNAIATVMIVMCTVLVSTIYPAIKASRSANPGIQRSWRIGQPAGDLYDIVFPFTVSAYDITGVASFLKEHFDNFSDTALGTFATASAHVFRQPSDMLGIQAEVALAPFDLGVSQNFCLLAQPSEIEGIDEIRILLRRLSGTRGDWQRSNRVFINEFRKQLLIWRSISSEIMEQYRQKTLQQWQQLPVEDVRPDTFGVNA